MNETRRKVETGKGKCRKFGLQQEDVESKDVRTKSSF